MASSAANKKDKSASLSSSTSSLPSLEEEDVGEDGGVVDDIMDQLRDGDYRAMRRGKRGEGEQEQGEEAEDEQIMG